MHNKTVITVAEALDMESAEKIADLNWNRREFGAHVMRFFQQTKQESDCFNVLAFDVQKEVVGRIFCIQNISDQNLWYFGDMLVAPVYRRQHIAQDMLSAAIAVLKNKGCRTLRSYVDPGNTASLNFHRKLGFSQKDYQPFNDLLNDGQLMFEKKIV